MHKLCKFLAILFFLATLYHKSYGFYDIESIAKAKEIIKKYQSFTNKPCTILHLNFDLLFKWNEGYPDPLLQQISWRPNGQNMSKVLNEDGSNLIFATGCSVFIVDIEFVNNNSIWLTEFSKNLKNQLWIVFGQMEKPFFTEWLLIEIFNFGAARLHCPFETDPRPATQFCPKQPQRKGQEITIASVLLKPDVYKDALGQFRGINYRTIDTFCKATEGQAKFVIKGKSWDEMSKLIFSGELEIGIPTGIVYERSKFVDFTSITTISTIYYLVPMPKPIDGFYQLLTPFSLLVWCFYLITAILLCFIFYFLVKVFIFKHKGKKTDQILDIYLEKSIIDYFIFPVGLLFEPLINEIVFFKYLWRDSKNGKLVFIVMIVTEFLMVTFYKSMLLSHLTATVYEKPIDTVESKY